MSPPQQRHHQYHKHQYHQHIKEQTPEATEEKQQEGYGSWMWRGLTNATSAAASYVAPSYMKDPDSDILTSPEDISLADYTKFQYCIGLYPAEPEPISSIVSWADLSQAIIDGDLDKADDAKKKIEEAQRQRIKKSQAENQSHQPRFFQIDPKTNVWDVKPELRHNLASVFTHIKK